TPDSNSRTAPSGKVMLIIVFSFIIVSMNIIEVLLKSGTETFYYLKYKKATSSKGRRNVVPP
ncbi:MAG: hypothetical protein ACLSFK_07100, partial [Streptococcus salivarius]